MLNKTQFKFLSFIYDEDQTIDASLMNIGVTHDEFQKNVSTPELDLYYTGATGGMFTITAYGRAIVEQHTMAKKDRFIKWSVFIIAIYGAITGTIALLN